ncbi:Rv3654c family TadE-like protein [Streptomyces sp. DSM 116494]|uniref:Rv3654c family TadE-like protein n=1 Tax=Streptomyces okerensis TaxID=3344655 RepID=UPI00388D0AFF
MDLVPAGRRRGGGPARRASGGLSRRGGRRRGDRRPAPGSDRGSATVWSVGAIAVLCVVFGTVLALGHAVVVRHRTAGGADLAALAAADHWMEGGTAACERADRVARAQNARLVRCAVTGEVSDVSVTSGRGPFAVEVRARAGPAGGAAPPTGGAAPDAVARRPGPVLGAGAVGAAGLGPGPVP